MKQFISTSMLLVAILAFGQESSDTSFLSKNQPIDLFPKLTSFEIADSFTYSLPSENAITSIPYQSGFMNFMANDNWLLNYPPGDLSDANDVIFGNFMNTSLNLGNNTSLNTIYIFDQSGRLMNSTTSISFGKKKK